MVACELNSQKHFNVTSECIGMTEDSLCGVFVL